MTTTVIENNQTGLSCVDVTQVTVDLVENALRNARDEMDAVLERTAISPGIKEQGDCFPIIANRSGTMVVGQMGCPFFTIFEGDVFEGDVILTNDPYCCDGAVSHLPDWLVIMPVFKDGKHIAWTGMFGHMSDNGGLIEGSVPISATSIFQEGIRIPPVKLYAKGELQEPLLKLILHNVRIADWNRSDLLALVTACQTAGRRCIELAGRFGDDGFHSAMLEMLNRNRRAMSKIIPMLIPEDPREFTDYICDDGQGLGPYKIQCKMWREGERVVFDFDGTSAQSGGAINYFLNEDLMRLIFGAMTINAVDPQILFNEGFYDLVDVRIPSGSILKPNFPAALSGRTHLLARVFDVVAALLGMGAPEQMLNGAGLSDSPHLFYSGVAGNGKPFQLFLIGFGGIPGRVIGDGIDGHSIWPRFKSVPSEHLEAYFPVVVRNYEVVADSGGAGLHRGGNGLLVEYEFREPGEIAVHDDRWLTYPWGVNGGKPGARSSKWLLRADGSREVLPSKCERIKVQPGDVLGFQTWGGAGWGDPLKRDISLVEQDVRHGLVSPEGAEAYGVVFAPNGSADVENSGALRKKLRQERGEIEVFDFGGTIEDIFARCEKETGLAPPKPPGTIAKH